MPEGVVPSGAILALFPFLVRGNLALGVLREMRNRKLDVTLLFCTYTSDYVSDPAEDFAGDDRLINLSNCPIEQEFEAIQQQIHNRDVRLVLQVGAAPMYRQLPFIKEKFPRITIVDLLYNERGHTVQHFLFEPAIDAVIVESGYMAQYVRRCSSKPQPNIQIVQNGVSVSYFSPSAENRHGGLVVGYLGRMSAEKNPFGFIELANQIFAAFPDTIFLMSGDGPLAAEVRERINMSLARAAFYYNGYNSASRNVLRQLDALIVPSVLDGRPNVIMEANACGVPVIAAPVGGIPEMINIGANGYLFPSTAVDSILQVLANWHKDPQQLADIKRSSRAFAEQFFDSRGMLDNYEQVFREFLAFSSC